MEAGYFSFEVNVKYMGWMREWLSLNWLDPVIILGVVLFLFLVMELVALAAT